MFAKVGRREIHGVPGGARVSRRAARRRRKEDGHQGQLHHAPSIFDNVKVPVENVLGEIGRGHIIAFNILNLGRLKLGPFVVGGAKEVLAALARSTRRSAKRSARPIAEFGMIQHKLAEMAIRILRRRVDELSRRWA